MTRYFFRVACSIKSSLFFGPVLAEEFDDFGAIYLLSQRQGRLAILVCCVHVGTGGDEESRRLVSPFAGRFMKRRAAPLGVFRMDICSTGKELFYDLCASFVPHLYAGTGG